ncbi:class II aldolase/adducin family protein [Mycobacterium sp. 663a-19]|uniref:class II aldolase/adducin family protein n=1 Tax=Mycobacterium sp. 663a-19 TaxID=2986148 RepID=UPI002D1EBE7C|nr:class II aldolase/adducin family protein [Mycobacterium sp. 663a-19]MEB3980074.1 class II aldolase/adducin family protein [Mycobacterium sp. 663a-19]
MDDPIEEVVAASGALAAAGLTDMVWGHASIRDPDGRGVWMKANGWGFEEVNAARVALVTPDGAVAAGNGPRHLEYPIHTEIMAARPDVQCVVHTHAPSLTAFASLDTTLRPISHDGVPFADDLPRFTATGALVASRELGQTLASHLGGAAAILMPNHGAVTVGPDAATAVMYAVLLERACRTQLMAMSAGGPSTWSDPRETAFKLEQCWGRGQLDTGYRYLTRKSQGDNR